MWPLFLAPKFKSADEAIQKASEFRYRNSWKKAAKIFTKAINDIAKPYGVSDELLTNEEVEVLKLQDAGALTNPRFITMKQEN
jgi:hypothetical protein